MSICRKTADDHDTDSTLALPYRLIQHIVIVCLQDIIAGWPNEMFEPYASYVYNVFQDQMRCPLWFEPFLHSAQRRWQRYETNQHVCASPVSPQLQGPSSVAVLIMLHYPRVPTAAAVAFGTDSTSSCCMQAHHGGPVPGDPCSHRYSSTR